MKPFGFVHMRVRPDEQIGLHEHPEWEISYVMRGSGLRTMGTACDPFSAGEVVMVRPDMPHCWAFDSSYDEIECISLFFGNDILDKISGLSPEMADVVGLVVGNTDTVSFNGNTLGQLSALLSQMPGMTAAQRIVAFQQALIIIASGNGMQAIGRLADNVEERIGRIKTYINCNYNRNISVGDIAAHAGMNRSAVCTFFRRHTGTTLIEAVNTRRIDVAKNLLRRKDLPIQQVCFLSGFNDVPYFFRLFKRTVGITPKEYRRLE